MFRCVTLKHLRSGSCARVSGRLRCGSHLSGSIGRIRPSVRLRPSCHSQREALALLGWGGVDRVWREVGGRGGHLALFTTGSVHEEFSQQVVDAVKVTLALPC